MASLTMYWLEAERSVLVPTKELALNYHPPGTEELVKLFKEIMEVYTAGKAQEGENMQGAINQVPAYGDVVSLKISAGEPPWYKVYSFHIREEDGVILFDAACALEDGYTTRKESPNGRVISFKMSEKDARGPFYHYYIREENRQILFDAHYGTPGSRDKEVNVKNIIASQEDKERN